ncbi:MAG: TMEM175 family protein, partial [Flavisolibacter sp.]
MLDNLPYFAYRRLFQAECYMPQPNPNARLEAFCDGVFAIALTLLVIDIKIPSTARISNTTDFWLALKHISPSIVAFVSSFAIILVTWVNHHNAMKLAIRSSTAFIYANGLLLLSVVFIPFPTSLIGDYILTDHASPAVILYNVVLIIQALGWAAICTAGLNGNLAKSEDAVKEIRKNRSYAYYSVLGYSILALVAVWIPVTVVIITLLLWILWLVIGINIKQ